MSTRHTTRTGTRRQAARRTAPALRNRWVQLAARADKTASRATSRPATTETATHPASPARPRRVLVDVVGTGRALVTITGGDQPGRSGLIGRRDPRSFHVENDTGEVVGHARTYAKAGALLAAHYGETVTDDQIVVDREK